MLAGVDKKYRVLENVGRVSVVIGGSDFRRRRFLAVQHVTFGDLGSFTIFSETLISFLLDLPVLSSIQNSAVDLRLCAHAVEMADDAERGSLVSIYRV